MPIVNPVPVRAVGVGEPGDAEVGELGGAVVAEQDVRGLHVAVHDPSAVGVGQPFGEVGAETAAPSGPSGPSARAVAEAPAVAPLEHEERLALVLAVVEQGDDRRVVEGSRASSSRSNRCSWSGSTDRSTLTATGNRSRRRPHRGRRPWRPAPAGRGAATGRRRAGRESVVSIHQPYPISGASESLPRLAGRSGRGGRRRPPAGGWWARSGHAASRAGRCTPA